MKIDEKKKGLSRRKNIALSKTLGLRILIWALVGLALAVVLLILHFIWPESEVVKILCSPELLTGVVIAPPTLASWYNSTRLTEEERLLRVTKEFEEKISLLVKDIEARDNTDDWGYRYGRLMQIESLYNKVDNNAGKIYIDYSPILESMDRVLKKRKQAVHNNQDWINTGTHIPVDVELMYEKILSSVIETRPEVFFSDAVTYVVNLDFTRENIRDIILTYPMNKNKDNSSDITNKIFLKCVLTPEFIESMKGGNSFKYITIVSKTQLRYRDMKRIFLESDYEDIKFKLESGEEYELECTDANSLCKNDIQRHNGDKSDDDTVLVYECRDFLSELNLLKLDCSNSIGLNDKEDARYYVEIDNLGKGKTVKQYKDEILNHFNENVRSNLMIRISRNYAEEDGRWAGWHSITEYTYNEFQKDPIYKWMIFAVGNGNSWSDTDKCYCVIFSKAEMEKYCNKKPLDGSNGYNFAFMNILLKGKPTLKAK